MTTNQEVIVGGKAIQLVAPKGDLTPVSRRAGGKYRKAIETPTVPGLTGWKLRNGVSFSGYGIKSLTDLQGNRYIAASGNDKVYSVKLSAAGQIIWQKVISAPGTCILRDAVLDSNGNLIIVGQVMSAASIDHYDSFAIKFGTGSGTMLWAAPFYTATVYDAAFGVAVDTSDNVYICGKSGNSGFALRLSAITGAVSWRSSLSNSTYGATTSSIVISGSECYTLTASNGKVIVSKFSDVGAHVWSRAIIWSLVGGNYEALGLSLNSAGAVVVSARSQQNNSLLVAVVTPSAAVPSAAIYSLNSGYGFAAVILGNYVLSGLKRLSLLSDLPAARWSTEALNLGSFYGLSKLGATLRLAGLNNANQDPHLILLDVPNDGSGSGLAGGGSYDVGTDLTFISAGANLNTSAPITISSASHTTKPNSFVISDSDFTSSPL